MTENINTEMQNEMTVGEILRNARTTGRRKREIQTIAKQLCIREEFLQALEDGKYDVIPETVYILGFARNYAMELGLDPDEIVVKLKREMGLMPDSKENEEDDKNSNTAAEESGKENKFYHLTKQCCNFVRKNWLWFTIGFVAVIAIVLILLFVVGRDSGIDAQDTSVVEQVETVVEPKYNVSVRERFGTENAETSSIILQATQESWVKIEDARGNTVFSRVLVPGDIYYVPSGEGYKAVFGNAGGMDVWVNGTLAPKQGADHVRVADIAMTPERLLPNVQPVAAE